MLTIRRLRAGEAARLRELRLRALRDAPYAFATSFAAAEARPAEHWEDFALKSEAAETQVTFIVAGDRAWVGMASAFVDSDDAGTAQLVQMWVAPESRGQGLGRRLVERLPIGRAHEASPNSRRRWLKATTLLSASTRRSTSLRRASDIHCPQTRRSTR